MKKITKRLTCAVLSLVMASGMATTSFAAGVRYGDVDKDGSINSGDALMVLTHSVGGITLKGDDFTAADVNGDKSVNSQDALDILNYAIGIIDKFAVEKSSFTNDEILALYSNAVSKARKERPSYKVESSTETTAADVKVNDPAGMLIIAGTSASQLEKEMKEEILTDNNSYYNTICKQGSTNSLQNLPSECTLTSAQTLKSIKLEVLPNGNYKIDISFNDEKNPKAGSTLCKAMGVPNYDETLKELQEESTVDGVSVKTDLEELSYKNCWIKCEINPATGEFVSLENNRDMTVKSSMSMIVKVTTSMSMSNTFSYSNFGY